jgi:hypothetical protein
MSDLIMKNKYSRPLEYLPTILLLFVITCFLFFVLVFLAGCAPIFSDLQSAKLVGKGEYEVTPGFSTVSFSNEGNTEHIQNHFGLQAAYGVHDNVDLRLRFERVTVDTERDESLGANVLGFGPKIGLAKDNAALYLPIGFAFGEDVEDISTTWEFHPTLLFTLPVGNNFEFNPSAKALIPLNRENADVLVAFNIGAGISSDLSKWVIRPEYGLLFNPGEDGYYSQFSIGLTVYP